MFRYFHKVGVFVFSRLMKISKGKLRASLNSTGDKSWRVSPTRRPLPFRRLALLFLLRTSPLGALETSAEPSFPAMQLKRARLTDDLSEKATRRPRPMELIHRNIIPVQPRTKQASAGKPGEVLLFNGAHLWRNQENLKSLGVEKIQVQWRKKIFDPLLMLRISFLIRNQKLRNRSNTSTVCICVWWAAGTSQILALLECVLISRSVDHWMKKRKTLTLLCSTQSAIFGTLLRLVGFHCYPVPLSGPRPKFQKWSCPESFTLTLCWMSLFLSSNLPWVVILSIITINIWSLHFIFQPGKCD